MTRVFISYGREDAAPARRLCQELARHGCDVWFDRDSLLPGQRWKEAVIKAIRSSGAVIALLSRSSVGRRGFLNREIREALGILDEFPASRPFLIPVRLDECEPSQPALSELHRVDMFPDWDEGLRQLRKALDLGTARRGLSRGFPGRAWVQAKFDRHCSDPNRVGDSVREIPGVVDVYWTYGRYDLMIVFEMTDGTENAVLHGFDKLESMVGIDRKSVMLVAVTTV